MQKKNSIVSRLSSDEDTAEEQTESEDEESALTCPKCGGKDFRARKVSGKGGQRLVCTKCGTAMD
jgi:predicted RNA-binding Zn-ribbon protein involved in translation (DUF1610 family)